MSSNFEDKPFSESHLDSPEYRKRLTRKLNTLIAVLDVACAKVRQSLAGEEPDVDRLTRIHKNLQDTLKVCKRAKIALERSERLPDNLPADLKELTSREHIQAQAQLQRQKSPAEHAGIRGEAEREKFSRLKPISKTEIGSVDIDALCDQFGVE